MLLRISASLLAIGTVMLVVFCELYLSYSGLMMVRDTVYFEMYEWLSSLTDETFADALSTTLVYTLPECFAVLLLYQLLMVAGRALGMDETTPANND